MQSDNSLVVRLLEERPPWLVRTRDVVLLVLPFLLTGYSVWYDALAARRAPTALEVLVFAVTGASLWSARRYPLVPTVLAALCWAVTGSCSFVMVMSCLLAARRPRWWPAALLGYLVLHPLGMVPVPCMYRAGHVTLPEETAPLVAVVLPAAVGAVVGEARRVVAAREARLRDRIALAEVRATEAAVEDRLRISREMHDLLGNSVSRMALHATAIAARTAEDHTRALATRIADIGASSVEDVRFVVGMLRGDVTATLDRTDLDAVLGDAGMAGAEVVVDRSGADALRPQVRAALEAVAAEAVHNARKHAPGAEVVVRLTRRAGDGAGVLRVDNGVAPDDRAPAAPGGYGLAVATERVAALGGVLRAGPLPDGGFRVDAEVPA